MTCLTCHDASLQHGVSHEKVGVRGDDASGLCVQCHEAGSPGSKTTHALVYGKAHVTSGNTKEAKSLQPGLDAESKSCMACHDGAVASQAGGGRSRVMHEFDSQAEHPIGVPMKATARSADSDFKIANPATLDRRIRLSGGNISCGSCHSMYSTEPAKLVMSNRGSKLCLSCHTQ